MHPYIANKIVPKSDNRLHVHKRWFNTRDIMDLIKKALPLSVAQTTELAKKLKGSSTPETLKNIYRFLKTIRYQVDPEGVQIVPLPSKILTDNRTDCKGLAIITHGILTNLGIPHSIRFAKYRDSGSPNEFTHVYVVVPSGNTYYTIDAVADRFNHEFGGLNGIYDVPFNAAQLSGFWDEVKKVADKVTDWYQGSDLDKALESAQDKAKDFLASFRSAFNNFWAAAKDRAERIWAGIKKYGPMTVAARNSFLLLVKENVFNMAGKLGYASASEEEAVNNGWDPQEYAQAKALWEKVKNAWIVFGGNVDNLINNINAGKTKKPKLTLGNTISGSPYIAEPVTLASLLASASAIIAVLKPVFEMIRPQKGSLPPGANGSEIPPYIPDTSGSGSGSPRPDGSSSSSTVKYVGYGLGLLALGYGASKLLKGKRK